MTSTNNTYDDVTMVVADLDGTLLHDGETFEDRFLTQRSIDSINRMHDAGIKFVVETARPVSTGYSFVQKLPVDAVAYLNGGAVGFQPPPRPITICSPHRRCRRTDICRRWILFEEGMRGLQVPAGRETALGMEVGHRHG